MGLKIQTLRNLTARSLAARYLFFISFAYLCSLPLSAYGQGVGSLPITYSGRLTSQTGAPLSGPVNISATFWDAELTGTQRGEAFAFSSVILTEGTFAINFPFTGSQVQEIFGDGTSTVYIEIVTEGRAYPRQKFNYVPLAMRVPVDAKSLKFSDTNGKLGIKGSDTASAGSVLVSDGTGDVKWDNVSASNLIAKTLSNTDPTANQVLTYQNGKWVAATPVATATSGGGGTITAGTGLSGGQITTSGTISLADTAVTAGSYTRANIVVDQQGRITSASNSAAIVDADISAAAAIDQSKIAGLSAALTAKQDAIGSGTTSQYLRGDKTWQTISTANVPESGTAQYFSDARARATLTGNSPIIYSPITGVISLPQADGSKDGYLTSTDWTTFSTKQVAGNYLTQLTGDATISGFANGAGTVSLASVALAGTSTKVTYDVKGRITSGTSLSAADIPTLTTSQITTSLGYAPINRAGDTVSGMLNHSGFDISNTGNIQMAASKTLALSTNTSDPAGLQAADKGKTWFNSSTNQIKYWDGSAAVALGVSGSGLSSLNGQTGNTQTFAAPGTSGTAPAWSSSANAHTLNIPMASTASVTAGLLSNADYTAFTNKVTNVAQGTGIEVATASGTSTVSLATTGTAGTYARVTTDAYGRVTAGTSLVPADLPPHSAGLITSGTLSVVNGGTGSASLALNNVILGNGTSPVQGVAPGTSGNVLTSNGTTWQSTSIWPTPGAIGSTAPNTGAFTRITSNAQAGYEAQPYGIAAGNTGEVRLDELAANGTNYVGFKAPDTLAANRIWTLPAADGTAGQILRTDGAGALSWVSAAAGSVTSVTGTGPISVATGTSTPVISISQANGSTNGFLNAADWTTFNAKQSPGNYVTTLYGDVTSTGYASGSVTTALASVALAGTATKVTYDVKGRVTSGTTLTGSDLPPHSASLITSGTLAVASGGTGLSATPTSGQILIGNGSGYTLSTLTGGTGITVTNAAGNITLSSTVDTSTRVAKSGDTMTGTLNLPANGLIAGANQLVLSGGNVGIGTTSPVAALDVTGQIRSKVYNASSDGYTINWNNGNIQYTTTTCGNFTLTNTQDGGVYSLIVKSTTSNTCTFSGTGLTFRSPIALTTAQGSYTVFTFVTAGSDVFVNMKRGY